MGDAVIIENVDLSVDHPCRGLVPSAHLIDLLVPGAEAGFATDVRLPAVVFGLKVVARGVAGLAGVCPA